MWWQEPKLKNVQWNWAVIIITSPVQFSCSVMPNSLLTHGTTPCQASLSITNSGVYSNSNLLSQWCHSKILCHFILSHPLLSPSIFPSIRVFSNESALHIRWPKYWSSTSVLSMNTQDWTPLGWMGLISLQSKELSRVFSKTIVQKHQFFSAQHFL